MQGPHDSHAVDPPVKPVESTGSGQVITAWSPLRHRAFLMLWLAWITANTCTWMGDVAAAWLMTTMSSSPVLVALVQTASTLPVLLLALPSGAVADIVDRRRWFIGTQLWVAAAAILLAVAAYTDTLTAPVLLVLVFANGVGLAMRWPVFAAIVPQVVPSPELPQALALHSLAVNASRIIGPLVAGALLASLGSTFVFVINALLSLLAAALIWRWRYTPRERTLPDERFVSAMRVGLQYVAQSPSLRWTMLRIFLLFLQVTALLALLPLVAKGMKNGGAGTFTVLMACMGTGAIAVALWLPRLRRWLGATTMVTAGTVLFALATAMAVYSPNAWVAGPAMIATGGAWIAAGNTLNVTVQLALPDWVRARGMAIFLMAAMAGGVAGSALWGVVASHIGVRDSLLMSSALAVMALVALRRRRVGGQGTPDLTPQRFAAEPVTAQAMAPDAGPVVVTVEYLIDPQDSDAFELVMQESRRARLRGGAVSWCLLRDAADPRRHVEYFVDESWVEHLRRFERLTVDDAHLRDRRLALHRGPEAPKVRRYLGRMH
jgi:MFS family permease